MVGIFAYACKTKTPEPPAVQCVAGANDRTQGCDEFKRLLSKVFKNSVEVTNSKWNPLETGDTLHTNENGEAELNFSDCWDGRLYLFMLSETDIGVRDCHKGEYNSVSNQCVPNGSVFSSKCLGEYTIDTQSCRMIKLGSSFSVTALPENRDITLVVVLEGRVRAEPVLSYNPTVLGEASIISGGEFYFTMPDETLSEVAGFAPRTSHPIEELGPVARELGVVEWMFDVRDKADEDGVLPENWPEELGGSPVVEVPQTEPPSIVNGFFVNSGGGILNDPRGQEAMYRAIDWPRLEQAGSPGGETVTASLGEETVEPINDIPRDLEMAAALLDEVSYTGDQPITVLYPVEDQNLEEAAHLLTQDLSTLGIEAVVEAVPGSELILQMETRMQAGIPVIALSR
jgi:hypothetical protein